MVPAKAEDATSGKRCLFFPHSVVASPRQIRNAKYVAPPSPTCLCGLTPNQHLSYSVLGLMTFCGELELVGGHSWEHSMKTFQSCLQHMEKPLKV